MTESNVWPDASNVPTEEQAPSNKSAPRKPATRKPATKEYLVICSTRIFVDDGDGTTVPVSLGDRVSLTNGQAKKLGPKRVKLVS